MGFAVKYKVRVPVAEVSDQFSKYATAFAFDCVVPIAKILEFFQNMKSFKCNTTVVTSVGAEFLNKNGQPYVVTDLTCSDGKRFLSVMASYIVFVIYVCEVPMIDTPSFATAIRADWLVKTCGCVELDDPATAANSNAESGGATALLALAEPTAAPKSPLPASSETNAGASAGPERKNAVALQETRTSPKPSLPQENMRVRDREKVTVCVEAIPARSNIAGKAKPAPRSRPSPWVEKIKTAMKDPTGNKPLLEAFYAGNK